MLVVYINMITWYKAYKTLDQYELKKIHRNISIKQKPTCKNFATKFPDFGSTFIKGPTPCKFPLLPILKLRYSCIIGSSRNNQTLQNDRNQDTFRLTMWMNVEVLWNQNCCTKAQSVNFTIMLVRLNFSTDINHSSRCMNIYRSSKHWI